MYVKELTTVYIQEERSDTVFLLSYRRKFWWAVRRVADWCESHSVTSSSHVFTNSVPTNLRFLSKKDLVCFLTQTVNYYLTVSFGLMTRSFFFKCSSWEKFVEKIGGLMSRTRHTLDFFSKEWSQSKHSFLQKSKQIKFSEINLVYFSSFRVRENMCWARTWLRSSIASYLQ